MEKQIEKYLRCGIEKLGGECLKLITPGKDGAPDRLVLWSPGKCEFIETKQPSGILSPLQKAYHKMLRQLGFKVYVLWDRKEVKNYLDEIQRTSISGPRDQAHITK